MPEFKIKGFTIITSESDFIRELPPTVIKIMNFLNKLDDKVLLTTPELARATGISYKTIRGYSTYPELADYSTLFRGRRIWGNKQTIKSFNKSMEAKWSERK